MDYLKPERMKELHDISSTLVNFASHLLNGNFSQLKDPEQYGIKNVANLLFDTFLEIHEGEFDLQEAKIPQNVDVDVEAVEAWNAFVRASKIHAPREISDEERQDLTVNRLATVLELLLQCRFSHDDIAAEISSRPFFQQKADAFNQAARKIRPHERWVIFNET
jgi:hypothetical protein